MKTIACDYQSVIRCRRDSTWALVEKRSLLTILHRCDEHMVVITRRYPSTVNSPSGKYQFVPISKEENDGSADQGRA